MDERTSQFLENCKESSYLERERLAEVILKRSETSVRRKECLEEKFWVVEDEPINFVPVKELYIPVSENKHKRNQEFICHVCGKLLVGRKNFSSHLNRDCSKKWHKCEYCERKFSQSCSLKYHVRTHTGESPFVCQICFKSFKALTNLAKHKTVHSEIRPFKCLICDKGFKNKFNQQIHTKKHYSVSHNCKFCISIFESRRGLSTHIQKKHADKKTFLCPECNKSYQYAKLLKQHMKLHMNIKTYSCVICRASFVWRSGLASHMKTHAFKLQCENCPSRFTSMKKLEKHRWRHSDSQLHKCTKCERNFKFAYLLKSHLSKHKEALTCSVCKLGFITKSKMKFHMKQHCIQKLQEN